MLKCNAYIYNACLKVKVSIKNANGEITRNPHHKNEKVVSDRQSGLKFAANLPFLFDQLCLPVRTVLHTADCVRRMSKYKEWERQHNVKESRNVL